MPRKKGQAPESYLSGALQKRDFAHRTEEERQAMYKKSAETRRKNRMQKAELQQCMKTLLMLPVKNKKQREILDEYGFHDEELINKTLLMVALYRKGLSGDVQAIKEIIQMMEKLDMYEKEKVSVSTPLTINLIAQGETYYPSEAEEKEIWEAENQVYEDKEEESWNVEKDDGLEDDWGNEVYSPK